MEIKIITEHRNNSSNTEELLWFNCFTGLNIWYVIFVHWIASSILLL